MKWDAPHIDGIEGAGDQIAGAADSLGSLSPSGLQSKLAWDRSPWVAPEVMVGVIGIVRPSAGAVVTAHQPPISEEAAEDHCWSAVESAVELGRVKGPSQGAEEVLAVVFGSAAVGAEGASVVGIAQEAPWRRLLVGWRGGRGGWISVVNAHCLAACKLRA